MKTIPAIRVTDGDQVRMMSTGGIVLEIPAGKGVIEAMLLKYLNKDGDLDQMECFHFQNWAINWLRKGFTSDKLTVECGEMEVQS